MDKDEFMYWINYLTKIYGVPVKVRFALNPNSRIRAEYYVKRNEIVVYNPISTTPFHEYGHAVYYHYKKKYKFTVTSEQFAQRFSTMWLNILKENFRCLRCGSMRFVPARPKGSPPTLRNIWLVCDNCGAVYELHEPQKVLVHYNP